MSRYDAMIDHTNLRADACDQDMETLCQEARDHGFAMVAVNSVQSALCSALLAGTGVHTGAAIGFPLGQTTIAVKVFETRDAIANGADEIDYVVNLTAVKNGQWDLVKREMTEIVGACRERGVIVKVIFENCYLTDDEKIRLCEIASEVRPDFIKTSTGFGTGGATFEDVALMRENVDPAVKVKAAGGIRDAETFLKMVELGAERIGTSAGVAIMAELAEQGLA
ncbi:deoxyribose-phosphate aldolase [Granulimonas faecalis]|uniref:Deoxyribose-phosphate aldolase n=1 Tax=Granulimonas faecalis TaxID=2894155 RepID=A0AAV5AYP3_9ACTN|nr:deoxyribose-phosphate aldolase [Atopobiaceae bacterium FL090493]GJM54407.1 deoxyribose-phosphate aldolase [Granulimonas faecalis]